MKAHATETPSAQTVLHVHARVAGSHAHEFVTQREQPVMPTHGVEHPSGTGASHPANAHWLPQQSVELHPETQRAPW